MATKIVVGADLSQNASYSPVNLPVNGDTLKINASTPTITAGFTALAGVHLAKFIGEAAHNAVFGSGANFVQIFADEFFWYCAGASSAAQIQFVGTTPSVLVPATGPAAESLVLKGDMDLQRGITGGNVRIKTTTTVNDNWQIVGAQVTLDASVNMGAAGFIGSGAVVTSAANLSDGNIAQGAKLITTGTGPASPWIVQGVWEHHGGGSITTIFGEQGGVFDARQSAGYSLTGIVYMATGFSMLTGNNVTFVGSAQIFLVNDGRGPQVPAGSRITFSGP